MQKAGHISYFLFIFPLIQYLTGLHPKGGERHGFAFSFRMPEWNLTGHLQSGIESALNPSCPWMYSWGWQIGLWGGVCRLCVLVNGTQYSTCFSSLVPLAAIIRVSSALFQQIFEYLCCQALFSGKINIVLSEKKMTLEFALFWNNEIY